MTNLAMTLEYDGTDFSGWQVQPGLRTVQGTVEDAVGLILQEKVSLLGAGRTDAGVHAFGQVANFRTDREIDEVDFGRRLNSVLPDDVVVRRIQQVPDDFHARYDATGRVYSYRIYPGKTAMNRRYVWQVPYRLDREAMAKAAELFLGAHDFSAFCVNRSLKENNLCTVKVSRVAFVGNEILYHIEADRFLHSMVRRIVGSLVEMGRAAVGIEKIEQALQSGSYGDPSPTAPPHGLCLVEVKY